MKRITYLAHPVGHEPARAENLKRAVRWLRWLIDEYPDRAFAAPWLAYCLALDESPAHRARGISDDLAMLRTCDDIVLVGGRLSEGMGIELREAQAAQMGVLDLISLGDEPPVRDVG